MHPIWIIAKRELASFFDSLIAYILLIAFLGFTGFLTWLAGNGDVFSTQQASMSVFFQVSFWTLFFFIPALTMRMLAEEKRSGTIELLLTKAVSNRQLVLGKFLACFLLIAIALAFTLPYYVSIASLGNIDHAAVITGYIGLLLMSSAYIGIGLFASSTTNNQIVSLLLALGVGILFHWLFNIIATTFTGGFARFFSGLSLSNHFNSISRGVLDSKDLIYFASLILLGLFLAELNISKRA